MNDYDPTDDELRNLIITVGPYGIGATIRNLASLVLQERKDHRGTIAHRARFEVDLMCATSNADRWRETCAVARARYERAETALARMQAVLREERDSCADLDPDTVGCYVAVLRAKLRAALAKTDPRYPRRGDPPMSSVEPADIPTAPRETAGSLGLCGPLDGPPGGGWPGALWPGALPDTAGGPDPATHPGPMRVLPAEVAAATRWFDAAYLPAYAPAAAYAAAAAFTTTLHRLLELPLAGPQLALGLQALLEARDCCVRAAIAHGDRDE